MSGNFTTVTGTKATDDEIREPSGLKGLFKTFFEGVWSNNPGLCQLLGLCPLLAVTTTSISALGLGIATLLVICCSSVIISIIRIAIFKEVRIPIYVMLIATLVTVVKFYMEAYFPDLNSQLGIYLALIVTNCIIMGRAEAYASHHNPFYAFADSFGSGLGFFLVLLILGMLREIIGQGTLFSGAQMMFGEYGKMLEYNLIPSDYTLMVAILPPGGFFLLAALVALKNFLQNFKKHKFEESLKIKSLRD